MATYSDTSNYSYIGSKNTLGGLPVVEQTKAYIATFKGVVSADPEVVANSSFFITYLVDADGNILKISEDSDAQRDVTLNFDPGDQVIVRIDQGTLLNPQLSGEHKITSLGSFLPILVTQTGSSTNAGTEFINFLNPGQITVEQEGSTVYNMLGTAFVSGGLINSEPDTDENQDRINNLNTSGYTLGPRFGSASLTNPTYVDGYYPLTWLTSSAPDPSAASWNPPSAGQPDANGTSGSYKFTEPLSDFTSLTFEVNWVIKAFISENTIGEVVLVRRRDGNLTEISSENFTIPAYTFVNLDKEVKNVRVYDQSYSQEFSVLRTSVSSSDEFFAIINIPEYNNQFLSEIPPSLPGVSGLTDFAQRIFFSNTPKTYTDGSTTLQPAFEFKLKSQNPVVPVQEPQPDYFTVGSNTSTILTASQELSDEYGNYQVLPTASSDFGFSPINIPFVVQPGDKIRFSYNQDNIFTIFNVSAPPTSSRLYLTLDRAPGNDINLRNFVLYRNLNDGKFITLDVFKNDPAIGEVDFTGIIIPKYASPNLKKNASEIVSKLKTDGIIED
jgi:hypothetical protein